MEDMIKILWITKFVSVFHLKFHLIFTEANLAFGEAQYSFVLKNVDIICWSRRQCPYFKISRNNFRNKTGRKSSVSWPSVIVPLLLRGMNSVNSKVCRYVCLVSRLEIMWRWVWQTVYNLPSSIGSAFLNDPRGCLAEMGNSDRVTVKSRNDMNCRIAGKHFLCFRLLFEM